MKILRAKGALIGTLGIFGGCSLSMVIFAVGIFGDGDVEDGIAMLVLAIILVLIGLFMGLRIYCTHWIQYGNGKVLIRCVINIGGHGPIGCWVKSEDEFLVEDIEAYGLSMDVLPHSVAYHRSSGGRLETECFFRLKSGEMIGYEVQYYSGKEIEAFYRYIADETGLRFMINEKRLTGKRKRLYQERYGKGDK